MNTNERVLSVADKIIERLKTQNEELQATNEKLRKKIFQLEESIASKNRIINRLQHDSWDDVSCERDR